MRDKRGIDVLAATAITETDSGGLLSQNRNAVLALMLMQVNTFIATGEASWRELGTWEDNGLSSETVVADRNQTMIIDIASLVVEGYCQNPANLLAVVNAKYPTIASDHPLQNLAGKPDARFESSIDATRIDQFRQDSRQPLQYVIEVPDATRAIVLGGGNVPRAWLGYQCPVGQQARLTSDPNTMTTAKSRPENHECITCPNVGYWWWQIPDTVTNENRNQIGVQIGQEISPNVRYIRVSENQRSTITASYGGSSFVADC